ncbi:DeoR/GlpR family DNA-binding transcription regulator [Rummeliibacillus pycnus]|uniref:DeoR/GlpR family DNA-binding transcription regulator n=1 Tax=Rummeliibacillus pycnus TaxID=101070 RepID=UPI003D2D72BD
MTILPEERKNVILNLLKRDGKVKVADLAKHFRISEESIRRDLTMLEEKGSLKKVYGGAIATIFQSGEPPFEQRTTVNQAEKIKIGKKAAELISDGDVIAIDVGTTMLEFAHFIQNRKNLTILTNSIPVATVLTESLNQNQFTGEILMLGGNIDPKQQSVSGHLAEQMLNQFNIDKAFISAGGVSILNGVSNYHLNESFVSRIMVEVSKQIILLADNSKLGVDTFSKICPLEKVDMIVCDQTYPDTWKDDLKVYETEWIKA